jgi:hypothetical protein
MKEVVYLPARRHKWRLSLPHSNLGIPTMHLPPMPSHIPCRAHPCQHVPYTHRDHHFWRLQYFHRTIHVILGPTSRIELTRTLRGRRKLQRTWSHSDYVTPLPVHPPFPHEAPGAQLVQWWCPCLPPSLLAPVPRPRELLPHALAVVAVPPASIYSASWLHPLAGYGWRRMNK